MIRNANTKIQGDKTTYRSRKGWRLLFLQAMLPGFISHAALCTSGLFNSGFANNGNIPDGTTTGWFDSRNITVGDNSIVDISIKLNITGGFNGDLYAYISHNGVLVPLLNRVGVSPSSSFGYPDAGFNITFSSSGSDDVHFYWEHTPAFSSGQLIGTWKPDGRSIDPTSHKEDFGTDGSGPARVNFSAYDNQDPNGTWTLFFADLSGGGGQSQIAGWELDITAVPEPVTAALAIFLSVLLATRMVRRARRLKKRVP